MTPLEHAEPIHRPSAVCAKCGAPLESVTKHHSRLVDAGGGATTRQDFCPACQAEARAGEYHSRWLAQRPAPASAPRRVTRRAQAARLREEFYRLTDQPEPSDEDRDALYLLAHLLMKTGGFRWKETDEEAGVIVFEDQSNKQRCAVQTVPLEGDRLRAAQERLSTLL
jgi:hypothetical protein